MENYFKESFKDILGKIKDENIKEQTVKAWVMAAEEGGWKVSEIDKIPFTLLTETEGLSIMEHTLAVSWSLRTTIS